MIDTIDFHTMEYSSGANVASGGFMWNLAFLWTAVYEREKQRRKSLVDIIR